jgi:hypothetical protein
MVREFVTLNIAINDGFMLAPEGPGSNDAAP